MQLCCTSEEYGSFCPDNLNCLQCLLMLRNSVSADCYWHSEVISAISMSEQHFTAFLLVWMRMAFISSSLWILGLQMMGGVLGKDCKVWPCWWRYGAGGGLCGFKTSSQAQSALFFRQWVYQQVSSWLSAPAPGLLACCHVPQHDGSGFTLMNRQQGPKLNVCFHKFPWLWCFVTEAEKWLRHFFII